MRRVFRFQYGVSLALVGLLPAYSALAHESISMPFSCAVAGGTVTLAASHETTYAIVGRRDERVASTCLRESSTHCRAVNAHRFDVACEGGVAAWIDIAAQIRNSATSRVWIEDGQLNLVLPDSDLVEAPYDCRRREALAAASGREVVVEGKCLPWMRKVKFQRIVLPVGFAPVGELGARLTADVALELGPQEIAPTYAPLLSKVAMSTSSSVRETTVAVIDPAAMRTAGTRITAWDTVLEPTYGADDWVTVVHSGSAGETEPAVLLSGTQMERADEVQSAAAGAEPEQKDTRFWRFVLAIGSVAVIAALMLKFMPMLRVRALRTSRLKLRRRSVSIANASATVVALLEQTDNAVAQLKGVGPLREVLLNEVSAVRERARNVECATGKGEVSTEKAGLQFRAMVRELDRIRRIVDSAVASLKKSGDAQVTLPQTASEAYEVLGVNAHASAGVLKKIVDALRMSWHPDHARDDADRELREQRIRQINIAWDLINGERKAA